MPTLEEFLAQGSQPQTLEDFLGMDRPGKLSQAALGAASRTGDISRLLESPALLPLLPQFGLAKQARDLMFDEDPVEAQRAKFKQEFEALPPSQSFGESAARFLGSVAPDVALGIATAPIAGIGAGMAAARGVANPLGRFLAGEALQSAALAPIEFGTRPPGEALTTTIAAPLLGTAVSAAGRGLARLFRPTAKPASEAIDEKLLEVLNQPEKQLPLDGLESAPAPALRDLVMPKPKPLPISETEIESALSGAPRAVSEMQQIPIPRDPNIAPREAENLTLVGQSMHVPLAAEEMNAIRSAIIRNAEELGQPQAALAQLENLERYFQAATAARTDLLTFGQGEGQRIFSEILSEGTLDRASRFRVVATAGEAMGRNLGKQGITLARVGELSDTGLANILRHEDAHALARRLHEKAQTDQTAAKLYDVLRSALRYQPWRMWDPMAEALAEMHGTRALWPDDLALRTGRPPGWKKPHGSEVDERLADLIALMSSKEGREAIAPKARQVLAPYFGDFPEGYNPKRVVGGKPSVPVAKEELTHLAPTQVGGREVTVGTVEAQAQKQELTSKIESIKATEAQERAEVEARWGKLTSEEQAGHKANLAAVLRENFPKWTDRQAKAALRGGKFTENIMRSMLKKGRPDIVQALEIVTGTKLPQPTAPGDLADALRASLRESTEDFGPEATRMFGDELDKLPPSTANKFLNQSEQDLAAHGVPMTLGNLWDRMMYWRRAAMVGSLKTALGNVGSTMLKIGVRIPQTTLSVALGKLGKAVTGVGPERSFGEVGALTLGYAQGISNMVRRLRGYQAEGMVGEGLLRFSEASRSIRTQIEGGDPFAHAIGGMGGPTVGNVARGIFKYGLEAPDRAMWDIAFSGEMMLRARQAAAAAGAKDVKKFMQEYLDKATREAGAAEIAAREIAEQKAPGAALKQAQGEATKIREAAKELLGQKKISTQDYDAAMARADETLKNAQLTPAEIEHIERNALRALTPQSIEEARFLAERSLFIAQENKMLDTFVDELQKNPVLRRISDVVLPFKRTPANVAREAVRSSPLGFATALPKLLEAGGYAQLKATGMPFEQAFVQALKNADSAGLTRLYDDLAQAAFGTSLMYATYALLDNGAISIHPYDPAMKREERLALEAQGIPTDSLVIGRFVFPLYRIEPLGRNLRAAQRLLDLSNENPGAYTNDAAALAQEYVGNLTDDVWLSGMGDLMEAVNDEQKLAAFANKFGGSFVPRFAQDVATQVRGERVSRRPTEGLFKEAIKGPSQALGIGKPDLGLFGRPRTTTALYGLTGFSMKADDPLLQELTAVDYFPSTRLPKIDLSEGESQDATQVKGFIQEQALKALIARPDYQALETPELKKKAMERTIDRVGARVGKVIRARKQAGMSLSYADLLQVLAK